MPEKLGSGAPSDASSIDPIAYDDITIFGLDPAVHWVHWNNQRDQFPEIVLEITKHKNAKGIFEERTPAQERSRLTAIRAFLLRAAGVTYEKINKMFGFNFGSNQMKWRFARTTLDDVTARRKQLAAALKRSS
jgi:hypothetical protein